MNELQDKIQEIKAKDRRNRWFYGVAAIVLTGIFLFIYFQYFQKKEKLELTNDNLDSVQVDNIVVAKELLEQKEKDSALIRYTEQMVANELKKIRENTNDVETIKAINTVEKTLKQIASIKRDSVIVRYYVRKDSARVAKAIRKLQSDRYVFHPIQPAANKNKMSNTLFYGKYVEQRRINAVRASLEKSGVNIVQVMPFYMGYEWKEYALEIGYEDFVDVNSKDNGKFNVRLYSFNSDRAKKKRIATFLSDSLRYNVEVFPPWKKLPSFFSKQPTILFYAGKNEEKAKKLAAYLELKSGVKFQTERGAGYGVTDAEKPYLFIIHLL